MNNLNGKPVLILLAGLAMAPTLHAGGPALSGLVAQADDAESAFSAPAGMSRLEGTHTPLTIGP